MNTIDVNNPTERFLSEIDIHTLLPQQEPFVMIGQLTYYDSKRTVTQTTLSADNLLMNEGVFSGAGMIENIAQTCAARIGYHNKYVLQKGVQVGVIGEVKKLQIANHPKAGDTITTTVEEQMQIMGMTLASATIEREGEVLATAQIKIAIRDNG